MNIGSLLTRHARYRPQHTALVVGGERLNWLDYNRRVNQCANALRDGGIAKGDKVAVLLPNCLELLDAYWGCSKLGAVVVPFSTLLGAEAIVRLMGNADVSALITDGSQAEIVSLALERINALSRERCLVIRKDDDEPGIDYAKAVSEASSGEPPDAKVVDADLFNIIYSSGTTGDPKGIVHDHYVRAMYCTQFAAAWRMKPESIVLHAGSIVFNGAFLSLMPALYLGSTYILHKGFEAERYIETIAAEGVTHVVLVPSQVVALLNSPSFSADALASLEMICSVGAPLLQEHKLRLTDALPNRFYELYGLTEGFMTVLDRDDYANKPRSVGVPPPLFDMRIVGDDGKELPAEEVGEITGFGPILMPGYYKRPDLTEQAVRDGWLHTGDLGYVDADGFLYLVDRKKDLIISGGVNVYPRDIEEILAGHPEIKDVAVFGVPHERWGECPVAAVVAQAGASPDPAAVVAWINERVEAKFQRVADVYLVEDFPRNTAGKTLKRVLRDAYLEAADA